MGKFVLIWWWIIGVFTAPITLADSMEIDVNPLVKSVLLQEIIDEASAHDSITLSNKTYLGNAIINKPLTLIGHPRSIIDAQGQGSAITIASNDVNIKQLNILNWGDDQYELNAGILINDGMTNIVITDNVLTGDGFGIRADNTQHIEISHNLISGDAERFVLDRGDGIYLKRVDHAVINGNVIKDVRDGVYLESGKHSLVTNNQFSKQQYGIHYMYTEDDEAFNNAATKVDGGYALMNSKRINLHHNQVNGAAIFGVLLNMTNDSDVHANHVNNIVNANPKMPTGDEGKSMFIYGARDNRVYNNEFANSEIGIYMAMGGEGNQIYRNQFINNQAHVKYVGDTIVEWSHKEQGNYWSGFIGWDRTGDGFSEQAYQPSDHLDRLYWLYPEAHFLLKSPVASLLRWTQQQFQIMPEAGVMDSFPMMSPTANSSIGYAAELADYPYVNSKIVSTTQPSEHSLNK
ncbi:nitrous oxide reductase family maturation protein NosD [Shewanella sp. 10N.286.51.B7]|uniref:nitrous oxide reductase family maturation protein NosD n=1 Tax=Shewanella sp. 10N.286.51.B7 TaxID=1880836 RepID=UPI00130012D9|nr:nitrous oxide reductase family maturation protein NosD [Shewanella sp. 10N.286.51.B7]